MLLQHLAANPRLATDLLTLHDLALYDSGDALLSSKEKASLMYVKLLAERLQTLTEKDFNSMHVA